MIAWSSFSALRRQLAPRIAPNYIVQLEEQVYIHDLPPEPRSLLGRSDRSVTRVEAVTAGRPGLGVLEAPAEVRSPELLRTLRGIETLERIGTPEATSVLRKLAEGPADLLD